MKILNKRNSLSLQMLYTGYYEAGKEWCYQNVISSFSRMYYISEGHAAVYMNGRKYELTAGDLFIIPKFTFHSYECANYMHHYYICFFDELIGGHSLLESTQIRYQPKATAIDQLLMQRFLTLNPGCAIQNPNPKVYDNHESLYEINQGKTNYNLTHEIESNGILLQLFSRFLGDTQLLEPESRNSYEKLTTVLTYIDNQLHQPILVSTLATLMCLSSDHFSRIFRKVMGVGPNAYIQAKRIERAQTLLITSRQSIKEIAESVGISNLSQFSKLFLKQTGHSPREYRETKIDN